MTNRNRSSGSAEADAAGAALRTRAREAGPAALDALEKLTHKAKSESVKLAAIKELLDRGFGRSGQSEAAGGVIACVLIDDGYPNESLDRTCAAAATAAAARSTRPFQGAGDPSPLRKDGVRGQ
jgi:hypothetical protein